MNVKLTIDGISTEVSKGSTVLDAAAGLGIDVPSMCYLRECGVITSCMICAVKDAARNRMIPSCSAPAEEGMVIETGSGDVIKHRKAALEMLLSEHGGDCEGPCRRGCPAWMDIPEMIRLIYRGEVRKALEVIKQDIPIPAVLGRICPAPCERVCRRKDVDEPVGICLLKRYAADEDLGGGDVYIPDCAEDAGKKVAVIGAGPAGLSAGYFLRRLGYAVEIFEAESKAGGSLRGSWTEKYDLQGVLDAEIEVIRKMGVKISTERKVSVEDIAGDFDAVVIATGAGGGDAIKVHPHTFETERQGVFAAGGAVRPVRMAVMAVAHGRGAACSVDQYLRGVKIEGRVRKFDSRLHGALVQEELNELMQGVASVGRVPVAKGEASVDGGQSTVSPCGAGLVQGGGFSGSEAKTESSRCMNCDCVKKEECLLRDYSDEYSAVQSRYDCVRPQVTVDRSHPEVVYEPGKCIKCGLCVEISRRREGSAGVGFINRGMETRVAAPFTEQIANALKISGRECAEKCPTGALGLGIKSGL